MASTVGFMQLVPITAHCPTCGSTDVVYSCSPHCCFNHVCGACRTSWQLRTSPAGRQAAPVEPAPDDYDTSFPTAPCAGCGGLVFQIDGTDELYCAQCHALLRLSCTEVRAYST